MPHTSYCTICRTSPFLDPRGSPSFFVLPTPAPWLSPRTRGRTCFWTRRCFGGALPIGHCYVSVLPHARRDFATSCVAALWAGLEHAAVEKCTNMPVTDPFIIVLGLVKNGAWLELYVQQDTAYTKTCQNGTVDVRKWSDGHHRILHGHSECQLSTKDFEIPTILRRSFMLTVERRYHCWRDWT